MIKRLTKALRKLYLCEDEDEEGDKDKENKSNNLEEEESPNPRPCTPRPIIPSYAPEPPKNLTEGSIILTHANVDVLLKGQNLIRIYSCHDCKEQNILVGTYQTYTRTVWSAQGNSEKLYLTNTELESGYYSLFCAIIRPIQKSDCFFILISGSSALDFNPVTQSLQSKFDKAKDGYELYCEHTDWFWVEIIGGDYYTEQKLSASV